MQKHVPETERETASI